MSSRGAGWLEGAVEVEEAASRVGEGRHIEAGHQREGRVAGIAPVDVELAHFHPVTAAVEAVVLEGVEGIRGASGGQCGAVQVGRQIEIAAAGEFLEGGGLAVEHLGPVKGVGCVGAFVGGHVVAVRPDAELEVVGERADVEFIGVVRALGIGALRDGHAHLVGAVELREQPAVGHRVVDHDRIAGVAGAVAAAPERAQVESRLQQRAGFVVDGDLGGVDHLDVVVGSDIADRVGRRAAAAAGRVGGAVEAEVQSGC